MHEVLEGHEGGAEHGNNPLVLPVSVTLSILAVLVAVATLFGHRAHTEELLLQTRATDQWAYYQAKNIRLREAQAVADMLGVLPAQDKERAEVLREKYKNEAERYEKDKGEISGEAREFEKERDRVSKRADRFDGAEGLLEIGLVIASFTLLTKRRFFWFAGSLVGVAGIVLGASGFFIR